MLSGACPLEIFAEWQFFFFTSRVFAGVEFFSRFRHNPFDFFAILGFFEKTEFFGGSPDFVDFWPKKFAKSSPNLSKF